MTEAGPAPQPLARKGETIAPATGLSAFQCPWCQVLAKQDWSQVYIQGGAFERRPFLLSRCTNCQRDAAWAEPPAAAGGTQMVFPASASGPMAHEDMPPDVRADFEEAREIAGRSPRGACALLRLAVQKLAIHLGQPGKDLNRDIGELVKQGMPVQVQQSLDALRVIGNSAVHPGKIDLQDNAETTRALFDLLNIVVENRITQPRQIDALYRELPATALEAIERRDGR